MKRSFTFLLALCCFSFVKSFSQNCISLGCAKAHTGVTTDGTLADTGPATGLGCYDGANYKQVYWQFFFVDPAGPQGDFTQTYTPTGSTPSVPGPVNPLAINFIVWDMGTIAPGSFNCPQDADAVPWTNADCGITDHPGSPVGPGLFGETASTTSGHYYAVAIIIWQGADNANAASYTFDIGTPKLGGANLGPLNCSTIVLPVKLTTFDARISNCGSVNLSWMSAAETDFRNYEVEYSSNGKEFQTVGTVALHGANQTYNFQLTNAAQGKAYYRLKMVNLDGTAEFSKTIAMRMDCDKTGVLVYPNPVLDKLNVNITNTRSYLTTASLFDSHGKLVFTGKLISGTNVIDMSKFASGVYWLNVKSNADVQNIKIIK